ncbi:unnamed protein product [Acanthoscelides obtectus]|uniref:Phosphatidate cytidylyltransferase n=1 Tax=Acanthoscelides obtectus TaxID=200917 RepID=A0A9P0JVJ0_ACAOB|nr:unnamed protein product [Acanthoscelides obtectus]CAK1661870.1 Phosphatidate cytidylyltransferase, photoreceptor-specific [Acanthoscelides obtectus]
MLQAMLLILDMKMEEITQKEQIRKRPAEPKVKGSSLKRTIAGFFLLIYFCTVIWTGPPMILFTSVIIQIKCFDEVINIAYRSKKMEELPHYKTLNWYFVIVANYFFFVDAFQPHIQVITRKYQMLDFLMNYHRFLAFCLYFLGLAFFLSFVNIKPIRKQFTLLAWTHCLLMIFSVQSYMLLRSMFQGLIWPFMPFVLVITNDVFSYMFGKLFGRTPLISLSPNKTLEGFIFGGIATFISAILLSHCFCSVRYLICPLSYVERNGLISISTNCTPTYFFQLQSYKVWNITFSTYPFVFHAIAMSCFASMVAPFGGFCASGLKRAVKIKDFADTIPGHGGLLDRFDCQFLTCTFINVYVSTFVKGVSVNRIYEKVLYMNDGNQIKFLQLLHAELVQKGMLNKTLELPLIQ